MSELRLTNSSQPSTQISVNGSVELLGIPADAFGCGLPFHKNVLAPTVTHGWGYTGTSNQNWPVILGGPYNNVVVAWSGAVPARPAYMPMSPDNVHAAARRICDYSLCSRLHERMRSPSISYSHIRNLRVNRYGDDREGPVAQYFLLQISVASVSSFSFLSVTSVSSYFWIACRIDVCVIFV